MKNNLIILVTLCLVIISCGKNEETIVEPIAEVPPLIFENLVFNPNINKIYFSTDGSMSAPLDSNQAKIQVKKVDITFIYDYDYRSPGFLDPKTRSQMWYWNTFYQPWLNNAVETKFYSTNLTKAKFDEAKANQSKIATYLADSSVFLTPHQIFPIGSCIGGRRTTNPVSISLKQDAVYGFKNIISGKKGLIYIRFQKQGWPDAVLEENTRVDIIREK